MNNRKRVVIGKIGLDSHDVGVRYVSKKLIESGFEVIFVQFYEPKELVNVMIQEDADIAGASFMTGGHLVIAKGILEEMKKNNVNIPLILGGIIPVQDHKALKEMGAYGVFSSGSPMDDIIDAFKKAA